VLPDALPDVGTERPSQMRWMEPDLARDLPERRRMRQAVREHRSHQVQSRLVAHGLAPPGYRGGQLQHETLESELRERIGIRELATHVVREHGRPPAAEASELSPFHL
jgi:hypothetical protein